MIKALINDKSLEETDILKLIIYALSFVSVCVALILFLLLPNLKEYQSVSLQENSQNALLNEAISKQNASQNKLDKLRLDNNHSLSQFQTNLNLANFQGFLSKYFQNVSIKKLNKPAGNPQDEYLSEILSIKASMKNPKSFYDFLDALQNYESLIKITYPLSMKATTNAISLELEARVYGAMD